MSKEKEKFFRSTAQFRPVRMPPAAAAPACLLQIHGSGRGTRVQIGDREIKIGRDELCDLGANESTVSRHHANVFTSDGDVFVEDLGSRNGTFVNDEETSGPRRLASGDIVRCGAAVFKFIAGGDLEALYHEEIHRLTVTDGLTQVANRRCLMEFLDREVARATRHDRPLAVALLDIDHFKAVNDQHGHLVGDHVLRGVADLARSRVRREELLARFGGEEFAVVMPETSLEGGRVFCERLRELVEAHAFEADGATIRVTISVGLATLAPGESCEDLVRRTDALLFRAKSAGRNRVESANPAGDDSGASPVSRTPRATLAAES